MTNIDLMRFTENMLVVMVLYNTTPRESTSFNSLYKNLGDTPLDILIYDNSLKSEYQEEKDFSLYRMHYIHDATNPGVSKAYNQGLLKARGLNKKWLLLLDQDTTLPPDFISTLASAVKKHPGIHLFAPVLKSGTAIISPCSFVFSRGKALTTIETGVSNFNGRSVLNSGLFISCEAFDAVGGFNEKIKLDFADFNFINRFKKKHNSFVITDAVCGHELSSSETDTKKVEHRFKYYCSGARNYPENSFTFVTVFLVVFLRTIKLALRFGRMSYFKLFYSYFMLNRNL